MPASPTPQRRRSDQPAVPATADDQATTTERPRPAPVPPVPTTGPATAPGTEKRLAEILAENGATPPSGGRRRRRYREDGESDDVLARVLGR
ncbi:hypothetical protein A6V29_09500 [Blastococcus sp. CCUG 61487]|nr:hypothetical protein A6V29_09500 [Blastococcus sp. CCUG 61487]